MRTTIVFRGLCGFVLLLAVFAKAVAVENVVYFHNDALGSPVAITDSRGEVLWQEAYAPYGKRVLREGGHNRLWYTGKPEDGELGLSYFGARWYEPEIGRFHGIDPVDFQEDNAQSFNRYAYANNNPYRYVDPDGASPLDVVFLAYDVGKLGVAVYTGQGVGAALFDVGASVGGVASPVPGAGQAIKAARVAKAARKGPKSLEEQAIDLVQLNDGKHRVTLRSEKQQLEIDLAGKDHAGIPTPHTKISPRNTEAPEHLQPAYNTSKKYSTTRASTQEEMRSAKRYLENKGR